jgi:hypothetical protein
VDEPIVSIVRVEVSGRIIYSKRCKYRPCFVLTAGLPTRRNMARSRRAVVAAAL